MTYISVEEFNKKVLFDMEETLNNYKTLAKYTKKTTKLKKHLFSISFWEEVIEEHKQECNL